jgi:hypothetical protein
MSHIDRRPKAPTARHPSIVIDVASASNRGMPTVVQHPIYILGPRDRTFNVLLDRISHVSRAGYSEAWSGAGAHRDRRQLGQRLYIDTTAQSDQGIPDTCEAQPDAEGGGVDGLDLAATIMMLVHSG